jgi:hypothetical protein
MQWQKKLYHQEENPPPEIWDALKNTLLEEPYQLRQSLYEFTDNPSAVVWENISTAIKSPEKEQPKTIIHNFRRTTLSYAAAIIGLGLFISILVFLLNNKPDQVGVKDLAAGINFQDSPLIDDDKKDTIGNVAGLVKEKTETNNNQVSESPLNKSDLPVNSKRITENTIAAVQPSAIKSTSEKTKISKSKINNLSNKKVSYTDGNYILVYGPDGEYKRVSYKLADMVQTLHNTNQSPKSQKASTQRWNKVLTEWKEKIGQSTFIPSGTNFFDIAEMAEMLNAEK